MSEVSNPHREWTVMFYLASDNALSPLVVSHIKAIKDAGYQFNTDVLVYFDPQEPGVPTKIYDVNSKRKEEALKIGKRRDSGHLHSVIGDDNDSFVRNMVDDELPLKEFDAAMAAMSELSDGSAAEKSLAAFVEYAISEHEAENYILFLLGHGMVVGNDSFLPDDDPPSGIKLLQLDQILRRFPKGTLQLLALNSCSMSGIEVAYQLKGAANYMIATQGLSFVNCWPQRQLLKKILNTVEGAKNRAWKAAYKKGTKNGTDEATVAAATAAADAAAVKARVKQIPRLIEKLYFHALFNSTDFLTAGYSADLVLCNLGEENLNRLQGSLQPLIAKLQERFTTDDHLIKDLVLLAHWDAQSFYEENYTDLFDFCLCLRRRCIERAEALKQIVPDGNDAVTTLEDISRQCGEVIKTLSPNPTRDDKVRLDALVVHADSFGWKYQYAHGLSIYFPWSQPHDLERTIDKVRIRGPVKRGGKTSDENKLERIQTAYQSYAFDKDFHWFGFLDKYWKQTQRRPRHEEDNPLRRPESELFLDVNFDSASNGAPPENLKNAFFSATLEQKTSPELTKTSPEIGLACACPSIKNYCGDIWEKKGVPFLFVTRGASLAFKPLSERTPDQNDDYDKEDE
jgi:Clostripain family